MKKYAKYIVSMSFVLPITAEAVTLGDITVKTFLNQPLDAYIKLIDLGGEPLSGLKVRLASPEAFKRAGLPRPYSLSKLSFKLERRYGKPIVKVTSVERIDEPFMTFMLDLTWAKGQYYRTYTVLLDPPGYDLALDTLKPPRIRRKTTRSDWLSVGVTPKALNKNIVRIPAPVNEEAPLKDYGPVKPNDDLWKIATRYKPDNLSVYQVMIAIFAFNRDSFKSENINGLKAGGILEIPTYRIISMVPKEKAKLEVEAQKVAWKTNKPTEHVLTIKYLSRAYYENKMSQTTNKTSYLPSLKFQTLKTKDAENSKTNNAAIPKKSQDSTEKKMLKESTLPTAPVSNPTAPVFKKTKKTPKKLKKQKVFEDFIPIPQVLTKIVKEPNQNKSITFDPASKTFLKSEEKVTPQKEGLAPELMVAASAIATVKESNNLLRDQVKTLIKQNELLREEAQNEKQAVARLKKKIETLTRAIAKKYEIDEEGRFVHRQAVKSNTHIEEEGSSLYWITLTILAVFILSGAGVFGLLYLKKQGLLFTSKDQEEEEDIAESDNVHKDKKSPQDSDIDKKEEDTGTAKDQLLLPEKTSKSPDKATPHKEEETISIHDEAEEVVSEEEDTVEEPNAHIDFTLTEEQPKGEADVAIEGEAVVEIADDDINHDSISLEDTEEEDGENEEESHLLEFEPGLAPPKEPLKTEAKDEIVEKTSPDTEKEGFIFELEPKKSDKTEDIKQPDKMDLDGDVPNVSPEDAEGAVFELEPHESDSIDEATISDAKSSDSAFTSTDSKKKEEALFLHEPPKETSETSDSESPVSPKDRIKSSTQLALAETYITMEDYDSAKAALEDVLEFGNEKQKQRAKDLMARIDKKKDK